MWDMYRLVLVGLRRNAFTCVMWQVTQCDTMWQVKLCILKVMGLQWKAIPNTIIIRVLYGTCGWTICPWPSSSLTEQGRRLWALVAPTPVWPWPHWRELDLGDLVALAKHCRRRCAADLVESEFTPPPIRVRLPHWKELDRSDKSWQPCTNKHHCYYSLNNWFSKLNIAT